MRWELEPSWGTPGAGECCVEGGRAQSPGWEAECQIWACPGALQCGCDSCAPHELGVGTGDTTMAPAGLEELLFPAVHPKFSVHIYIYLFIYSTSSPSEKYKIQAVCNCNLIVITWNLAGSSHEIHKLFFVRGTQHCSKIMQEWNWERAK